MPAVTYHYQDLKESHAAAIITSSPLPPAAVAATPAFPTCSSSSPASPPTATSPPSSSPATPASANPMLRAGSLTPPPPRPPHPPPPPPLCRRRPSRSSTTPCSVPTSPWASRSRPRSSSAPCHPVAHATVLIAILKSNMKSNSYLVANYYFGGLFNFEGLVKELHLHRALRVYL
ncbi:unnamed protein product [Urochloa humidicola]